MKCQIKNFLKIKTILINLEFASGTKKYSRLCTISTKSKLSWLVYQNEINSRNFTNDELLLLTTFVDFESYGC